MYGKNSRIKAAKESSNGCSMRSKVVNNELRRL